MTAQKQGGRGRGGRSERSSAASRGGPGPEGGAGEGESRHGFRGRRRGVEGGGRAGHESSWRRRTRHGRRVQRQGRRSEGGRGLAVVRERVHEPKSRHGRRGPGLGEEGRVREFQEQSSLSERAAQGGAGHQEAPGDAQEKRSAVTKPARRVRPVSCQAGGRARGHSRSVALVVSCRHGRLLCFVP